MAWWFYAVKMHWLTAVVLAVEMHWLMLHSGAFCQHALAHGRVSGATCKDALAHSI